MSSLSELKEANPDMPDAQYGFHRDFVGAVAVGDDGSGFSDMCLTELSSENTCGLFLCRDRWNCFHQPCK